MSAASNPEPAPDVQIDGSLLEGGGQMLRLAAATAVITGKVVSVSRIRGLRPKPGLAAQHLAGLRLLASAAGATVPGAAPRSSHVTICPPPAHFHPPPAATVDVGTAGSVALTLVPAMLAAVRGPAPQRITVRGGTDVAFSPPFAFLEHALQPFLLRHTGVSVHHGLQRPGFFPRGGGSAVLTVHPCPAIRPIRLTDRGDPVDLHVTVATNAPLSAVSTTAATAAAAEVLTMLGVQRAAARAAARAGSADTPRGPVAVRLAVRSAHEQAGDARYAPAPAPAPAPATARPDLAPRREHRRGRGAGRARRRGTPDGPPAAASAAAVLTFSSGAVLSGAAVADPRRGETADQTLDRAVATAVRALEGALAAPGACVDEHLQDQITPFMALATGPSELSVGPLTMHTRGAVAVLARVTGADFTAVPVLDGKPREDLQLTAEDLGAGRGGSDDRAPIGEAWLLRCTPARAEGARPTVAGESGDRPGR